MAKVKSVEDFLLERLNAKYAGRIFGKINTEFERLVTEGKTEPGPKEYQWMLDRVRAIHKDFFKEKEVSGAEETKD